MFLSTAHPSESATLAPLLAEERMLPSTIAQLSKTTQGRSSATYLEVLCLRPHDRYTASDNLGGHGMLCFGHVRNV